MTPDLLTASHLLTRLAEAVLGVGVVETTVTRAHPDAPDAEVVFDSTSVGPLPSELRGRDGSIVTDLGGGFFAVIRGVPEQSAPVGQPDHSYLADALERGEFVLYVQPKVDIVTGEIVAGEALARWVRDGVVVPPAEFVELLERGPLAETFDRWVITEAARIVAAMRVAGPAVRIWVNVNPRHLCADGVVDAVLAEFRDEDRSLLGIEVTERLQVPDMATATRQIQRLRDVGVEVALDDFGTGASSLVYVARLPIDEIKIDGTFVREVVDDRNAKAVCSAVGTLGASLGLEVCGEQIETVEQARALYLLGVSVGQGYLWSRPVPAPEFIAMLSRSPVLGERLR